MNTRAVKASRYRIQYPCIRNIHGYVCLLTGKVLDRAVHAETSKNEDTWRRALGHYNAEFYSTLRISRGGVLDDALCNLTVIRTCSVRTATMTARGSMRTTTGSTTGGIVRTGSRSWRRNSLHFSSAFAGEFCFCTCPCHPPSMRPTSSSLPEIAIYFLLSSDFVSQSIRRKIFKVSSFRMATLKYGSFSCFDVKPAVAVISISSTNSPSIFPPSVYRCAFGRSWW